MVLEWYPWEAFSEVEKIGEGAHATVFRAKTNVQRIEKWDQQMNEWSRLRIKQDKYIALKTMGDSESKDFMNEVTNLVYYID